jgi:hypothetical protein
LRTASVDLVADENVDAPIVTALRGANHRVIYVRELDPGIGVEHAVEMPHLRGPVGDTPPEDEAADE